MKEETEIYLLTRLIWSNFKKRLIGTTITGCKADFREYLGYAPDNKDIRKFLQELIQIGALEKYGAKETRGGVIPAYVVNVKKMMAKIRQTSFGKTFYESVINDYLGL